MWPSNALTERLNLQWPILQAPMGSASTPALAAAVTNAGGLGGLGMWGRSAEQAARRIAGFRQQSGGSLNVNYPIWPDPHCAPEIAENGAVVPIAVSSTLADVSSISILVAENPNALAASYRIPAGTMPNVANRLKMAKTSNVIAVVEAGGKLYSATKEVKVTVGGCGG